MNFATTGVSVPVVSVPVVSAPEFGNKSPENKEFIMKRLVSPSFVVYIIFTVLSLGSLLSPWLLLPLYVCLVVYETFLDDLPPEHSLKTIRFPAYTLAICCALGDLALADFSLNPFSESGVSQLSLLWWGLYALIVLLIDPVLRGLYEDHAAPAVNRRLHQLVRS